ncbi:hypothetical protein DEO72_LG10g2252 [Vigna unguiculata]|uniref:Uncharacterized protein n=1 Tax=Vigna unguiculata TaxID=3917 RepID=A0A4D6NEP4_VIGUN|nr:hypothetical protein DEO72_LG10g2251 [Vigna unguiculata]QCE11019.1 hypothetical protein DEO72_LG10g2252 [Vigna unguiculata]
MGVCLERATLRRTMNLQQIHRGSHHKTPSLQRASSHAGKRCWSEHLQIHTPPWAAIAEAACHHSFLLPPCTCNVFIIVPPSSSEMRSSSLHQLHGHREFFFLTNRLQPQQQPPFTQPRVRANHRLNLHRKPVERRREPSPRRRCGSAATTASLL